MNIILFTTSEAIKIFAFCLILVEAKGLRINLTSSGATFQAALQIQKHRVTTNDGLKIKFIN